MMFKSHFGETVTVVLAIIMGLIMSLGSLIVDHLAFNFSNLFKVWAMITLVILLVSIIIPYKDWSAKVTAFFSVRKDSIPYKMIDNVLPSLILNTCNTVVVSAAMILCNESIPAGLQMTVWLGIILHDWPIMFVISYFSAFIAEAAGLQVAKRWCAVVD